MIEFIRNIFAPKLTTQELFEKHEYKFHNNFRQRVGKDSDGYFVIDQLKDRCRKRLEREFILYKITEDESIL
jgi:hypothetical protein|tara:strand:- start:6151 stop:6366 length:216 start_codon:yes stop_codon:yes gene_type:complete